MNSTPFRKWSVLVLTAVVMAVFPPAKVSAHCDTMNGPVVTAAKKGLETGDVNPVLVWVQKNNEAGIREAFQRTLAVRKLNAEARNLADLYFFETLVRIHRAGEGVAYIGLKPAGAEVEPGIKAADDAIESGSTEQLLRHLDESIHQRVNGQFKQVMEKKSFKPDDVEAGREYVKAYVQFIHFVERLHQAAVQPVEGHIHEPQETGMNHEEH